MPSRVRCPGRPKGPAMNDLNRGAGSLTAARPTVYLLPPIPHTHGACRAALHLRQPDVDAPRLPPPGRFERRGGLTTLPVAGPLHCLPELTCLWRANGDCLAGPPARRDGACPPDSPLL